MLVNQQQYRTIWPNQNTTLTLSDVSIIDQTKLPHRFEIVTIQSLEQMIDAINNMQVRGAPLIGAAAAYGVALAMRQDASDIYLNHVVKQLIHSRPTAVNLKWAAQRMLKRLLDLPVAERLSAAWREAAAICDEDVRLNQSIGGHGLGIIKALAAAGQN